MYTEEYWENALDGLGQAGVNDMYQSRDYFVYQSVPAGTILQGGGTAEGNISIEADADFRIVKTCFTCFQDQTDTEVRDPLLKVTIRPTGSGQFLENVPVFIQNIAGNGELPFIWPFSKVLFASSTLAVEYTNLSNNNDYNNISISFIGEKLYKANP